MDINNKTIGVAFTGSFCTYKKSFLQLSTQNKIPKNKKINVINKTFDFIILASIK